MPAPTKSLVTIPDEAITRLRSLERLDESPFLQRKSFCSASGAAGSRRKLGSSNNELTSRKAKPAITGTTPAIGGPETSIPLDSSLGRRPRELPWLVTPAPAVTQATIPVTATSSSRVARPSTTPSSVPVAGPLAPAATAGRGGGEKGLSRNASVASARGSSQGGPKKHQLQRQTGGGDTPGAEGGAAGVSAFEQGARSLGSGGGNNASGPSGNQEYEDDETAEVEAAAAAVSARFVESERARLRRQALTCASMELPAGSSSPTSDGARGADERDGNRVATDLGLGLVGDGSLLLQEGMSAREGVARGPLLRARKVLPRLTSLEAASQRKVTTHHVRAAAWLAILKMVAFVARPSATLKERSAIPLDGLEAGLLRLLPFRLSNDGVIEDHDRSSQASSSQSFASSRSALSGSSDGGGGDSDAGGLEGGESSDGERLGVRDEGGQDETNISGADYEEAAGRTGKNSGVKKQGQQQPRLVTSTDRADRRSERSPRQLPLAAPAASHAAADAGARPDTSGSDCGSTSAKLRKRDTLPPFSRGGSPLSSRRRCRTTSSTRKSGWVRGSSRGFCSSAGGGNRGPRSRGEGGSPDWKATGCWVPPPTRWGGVPIRSPSFWDDRGDHLGDAAHRPANAEEPDGGDGRRLPGRGEPSVLAGGHAVRAGEPFLEWGGEEERREGARGADFGTTGEFFRTADGRSLFAESLGNLSSHGGGGGGGGSKRRRGEIQWGGNDDGGGDDHLGGSGDRLGLLCRLGEEGFEVSERGHAEGTRLGVAARHRRARIDARSRDGKRRAEMLSAKRRKKRLEDEYAGRRTDKLEKRANLTKSRGEAAVTVLGDRGKTLLWVMVLASRTCYLRKLLAEAKGRREAYRSHLTTVAFALRIQRAWRSFREEARLGGTGAKNMRQTLDAILRVSLRFIVCRRARVLALLKLWPEGEAVVKMEMRTGKRIRTDGSWKSHSRRRSSRLEPAQTVVPRGSVLAGSGAVGGMHGAGHSGHGGARGTSPVAGEAMMAEAAATAATAAAPHVSPPWLPRLVKEMETRKHETVHRLMKTQAKLSRHRRANEAAWMSMTPGGRAYQEGQYHHSFQHQQPSKHHARHERRANDRGGSGSRGSGDSGGSSIASTMTDATISSAGSGTQQQQNHRERRQKQSRSSRAATATSERSEGDDSTQDSLSGSAGNHVHKDKRKKRHRRRTGEGGGGSRRRGSGGGAGGATKVVSISTENDLEEMFDDGDANDRSPILRIAPVAGAGAHHQLSRTTPASSSSGSVHRVLSATGWIQPSQQQLQRNNSSHRGPVLMRDMSSLQLLTGVGWPARLSEIDREIDAAPLVPLPVKLATIESFVRAETMERIKSARRDRASQTVHREEATLATAKALLHGSIEDFVDQVEATQSSDRIGILQLYSGQARLRFMAEVDRKVRLHMEKGNRRVPVGVRT